MVIDEITLETLNQVLLAQNVYDGRTQSEMNMFLYGNSTSALSYMCGVMRQFNFDVKDAPSKQDLTDSLIYYKNKNRSQAIKQNVSAKLISTGGKVVAIEFRLPDSSAIKDIEGVTPISISTYSIIVHLTDAQNVLTHFRNHKLNVSNIVKYMKSNGVTDRYFRNTKDLTPAGYVPNKIVLKDNSADAVQVIADELFNTIITNIRGYKWIKSSRKHIVPKNQLFTLYSKIQQYATEINFKVDISDFSNYLNLNAGLDDTPVVCSTCETITYMQLPIHPVINNALITIPTLIFNEERQVYIFKTRHLKEVYDKLVDTQLQLDLQPIVECMNNNIITRKRQTVHLIDYRLLGISRKPWKHQIEGAKTMLEHRKMILADEMGTGKTFTAILASMSVVTQLNSHALVICPSSVKYNWKDEIRQLDKTGYIHIVEGTNDYIPPQARWVIINYDILGSYIGQISNNMPACLIVDEAHRIKGIDAHGMPATMRAKNCLVISGQIPYVFPLTGTPTLKGNIDLFNLLVLIDCPLSDNFADYGFTYCDGKVAKTGGGYDFSGSSNEVKLNHELKDYMIRHRKSECLDLPDKLRTFMRTDSVDLTRYQEAVDEYMKEREYNTAVVNLVLVGQMKKFLAYAKCTETIGIAKDLLSNGDNVVIFSDYTYCINTITNALAPFKIGTITGADSSKAKLQKCKDFNNGRYDALVCNIKAGGEGLNMTRANKMIINDLTWIPAMLFQVEDRIHRGGQQRKVEIIYPIAEQAEIDIKLADIIEKRAKSASQVADGMITADKDIKVMQSVLKYLEDVKSNKRIHGFQVDTDSFNVVYTATSMSGETYTGKAVYYAPIEAVINISIPQKPALHSRLLYVKHLLDNFPNVDYILPVKLYSISHITHQPEELTTVDLNLKSFKRVVMGDELEFDEDSDKNCFYVFPHGETLWVNQYDQHLLDSYRIYYSIIDCFKTKILTVAGHSLNLNTLVTEDNATTFQLDANTLVDLSNKQVARMQIAKYCYNYLKSPQHMQFLRTNLIEKASITFQNGATYEIQPTEDDTQFTVVGLDPTTLVHPDMKDTALGGLSSEALAKASEDDGEFDLSEEVTSHDTAGTGDALLDLDDSEPVINPVSIVRTHPLIIQYAFVNPNYKDDLFLQMRFTPIENSDNFSLGLLMLSQNRQGAVEPMRGWSITKLNSAINPDDALGKEILSYLRRIEKAIQTKSIPVANSVTKHLKLMLESKINN